MAATLMDQVDRLRAALADRYELDREIGAGGMAHVFHAHDRQHDRDVAIKVMRPELSAAIGVDRFLREIRIEARLQHPNILPLHDSGAVDGLLYYVMPYVEGESLRERIRREKQLGVPEAIRIAREVADALDYAHRHNVVHRDIKPGNILLSGGHPLVADFGLARPVSGADEESLTASGIALGTAEYMSPEQASGEREVDGRSDIYALGCVLYEMLAGDPPFTGRTVQSVLARHRHDPPPRLSVVRPGLPPQLEEAVERSLAKVPADRFATAAEFGQALSTSMATGAERKPVIRSSRFRSGIVVAAMALSVSLFALSRLLPLRQVPLDPSRILVLPIGGPAGANLPREDATLALVAALSSTPSLTGLDGAQIASRSGLARGVPTEADAAAMAKTQHARYYVEGTLLASDSLRLLLRLHDAADHTITVRTIAFRTGVDGWSVGIRAASELLSTLMPIGASRELPSLEGRAPGAIAEYFLGERAYRRAAFGEALAHFRSAVGLDSGFALAALRGAQAASWYQRPSEANGLVRLALAHNSGLAPRQAELARGLYARFTGKADSAVERFRSAIALDPHAAEPWMWLGEVYYHLLPSASPVDSLAEQAFLRARELDPGFAEVLYHLTELAIRHGELDRAARLLDDYRRGDPDPGALGPLNLMLRCARRPMSAVEWREAVLQSPAQVFVAAQKLTVGGLRLPACARGAWEAMLTDDTTSGELKSNYRFNALICLQSLLVAQGRDGEARDLLERDTLFHAGYRGQFFILDALAGGAFQSEADAFSEQERGRFRADPTNLSSIDLWFLGTWEAHRGRAEAAESLGALILRRAPQEDPRRDSLLAHSLSARATLARGDSTGALQKLTALVPTAPTDDELAWRPWESLGAERLLLAQLLFARGEFQQASGIAANFDSPAPPMYVLYLPASLRLRFQAADRLGDTQMVRQTRARLDALSMDKPVSAVQHFRKEYRYGKASPQGEGFPQNLGELHVGRPPMGTEPTRHVRLADLQHAAANRPVRPDCLGGVKEMDA